MKTRIGILISIAALLVSAVVFAAAQGGQDQGPRPPRGQGGPGGPGGPPPPPFGVPDIEHLSKALNLTDAQKTDLKGFLDSERATVDALMQKLGDTHKQIEDATKDGKFDEAQVRTLASQHAQVQADLIVEQERVKARIFSALTPEQRATAEQMHRHMHRGPGGPGGPGGPPPPPPPQDNN